MPGRRAPDPVPHPHRGPLLRRPARRGPDRADRRRRDHLSPRRCPRDVERARAAGSADVNAIAARYPEHHPARDGQGRWPPRSFVCGFLGCDRRPFNPLLAALPRRLHMPAMSDGWLDGFTRQLTEEVRLGRAGADSVLTRVAELMFIEVLRRYLETCRRTDRLARGAPRRSRRPRARHCCTPGPATRGRSASWPARSPRPAPTWRKRFTELVGQPPMQYLDAVADAGGGEPAGRERRQDRAIAAEVGYESEAAFSRAFKQATGLAPGAWREARRDGRAGS